MNNVVMILSNLFRPDVRVHREALFLIESGYEVEILCWDRQNEFKHLSEENIEGIKVKRFFPFSVPGTGAKQIFAYVKFIIECKKYIQNKQIDYLHCHDLDGIIVGILLSKKTKKIIFDMHEFYEPKKPNKISVFIRKKLLDYLQTKSTYIIYVNEAQVKYVDARNLNKMVFLPNYPLMSDFNVQCKSKNEKLRISYIGVVRQYDLLLNLFEACKEMTTVEIYVHGSGVHYEKVKEVEKKYHNVYVTGPYNYKESSELYRNSDLVYIAYVVNNYQNYIGEPVKFFEAIASKTPIIVSRKMKIAEFVENHEIGVSVDSENIENIRKTVECLQNNREQIKEYEKNIKEIHHLYNWENVKYNLNEIYKSH